MKNDVKILVIKEVKPLGRGGQVKIEFKQKSEKPYTTSAKNAEKFHEGMKVKLLKGRLSPVEE